MAVTTANLRDVSPGAVFAVLEDGWSYGAWVVGTKEIRQVDATWPRQGSCLHYTVGVGPISFGDVTEVKALEPPGGMVLEARGWPAGTVGIRLTVEPTQGGTRVVMREEPERGLARWLHNPAFDLFVKIRNREALRRLGRAARRIGEPERGPAHQPARDRSAS